MMNKDLTNHYIGRRYTEYPPDGGCFGSVVAAIIGIIICGIITLFVSCTHTEYVTKEVPVIVHDTLASLTLKADTFIVTRHDSVWNNIFTKGDTIFVDRGRESTESKLSHNIKHDTIRVYVNVPVEVTNTEIKEVEKPPNKKQLILMALGKWMIATIVLFLLFVVCYIYGIFSRKKNV